MSLHVIMRTMSIGKRSLRASNKKIRRCNLVGLYLFLPEHRLQMPFMTIKLFVFESHSVMKWFLKGILFL